VRICTAPADFKLFLKPWNSWLCQSTVTSQWHEIQCQQPTAISSLERAGDKNHNQTIYQYSTLFCLKTINDTIQDISLFTDEETKAPRGLKTTYWDYSWDETSKWTTDL